MESVIQFSEVLQTTGGKKYMSLALVNYVIDTNKKYKDKISYENYVSMDQKDEVQKKIHQAAFQ